MPSLGLHLTICRIPNGVLTDPDFGVNPEVTNDCNSCKGACCSTLKDWYFSSTARCLVSCTRSHYSTISCMQGATFIVADLKGGRHAPVMLLVANALAGRGSYRCTSGLIYGPRAALTGWNRSRSNLVLRLPVRRNSVFEGLIRLCSVACSLREAQTDIHVHTT